MSDKMREALKLARKALRECGDELTAVNIDGCPNYDDAMDAIDAALAEQPAQGEAAKLGRWSAVAKSDHHIRGVWVESDDFTHDVRLYVNGDFADQAKRLAYAEQIAAALNAPPAPAVPDDVAYLAGALAMQEKIARAIEMSPRKSDAQVAAHIRANIKPVTAEQAKQWDDDARALLATPEAQ